METTKTNKVFFEDGQECLQILPPKIGKYHHKCPVCRGRVEWALCDCSTCGVPRNNPPWSGYCREKGMLVGGEGEKEGEEEKKRGVGIS
jgi:hypothetical protein